MPPLDPDERKLFTEKSTDELHDRVIRDVADAIADRQTRVLWATDFDGVLAEFVPDPMMSRALPASVSALLEIDRAPATDVVVITGGGADRALHTCRESGLVLPIFPAVGTREISLVDGELVLAPDPEADAAAIRLTEELRPLFEQHLRAVVGGVGQPVLTDDPQEARALGIAFWESPKGYFVALHGAQGFPTNPDLTRQMSEAIVSLRADPRAGALSFYKPNSGTFEVGYREQDKRVRLESLASTYDVVIYSGDDIGDATCHEFVTSLDSHTGYALLVRNEPGDGRVGTPTQMMEPATVIFRGPVGFQEFLTRTADRVATSTKIGSTDDGRIESAHGE